MKQTINVHEMLNHELHPECLFHFIAENGKKMCLVCVVSNMTPTHHGYGKDEVILVMGCGGDSLMSTRIKLRDFYLFMLGKISLPGKLKLKEVII